MILVILFALSQIRLLDDLLLSEKDTENLYQDSIFGEWLDDMPKNISCNYDELNVDCSGNRVEITFFINNDQ